MLEFRAAQDFRYNQHNASPAAAQAGRGGERYYTTSQAFANGALVRNPQQFRILDTAKRLKCLAREHWDRTDFSNKRALFLLPSAALGNNVCTLLFLHAFAERWNTKAVGVFCAQSAADIYLATGLARVYALWISRRELADWDILIDLGHLESRRNIEFWPVDMEADLLDAFGLQPSRRFPGTARPVKAAGPLKIGLLPLASSPLRTLPVAATAALLAALAGEGEIELCLNRNQHQGILYRKAIEAALPPAARVVDAFPSIGALLTAVDSYDYAVFADSGPAHMAKLSATPGVAVYTSAPGDVLQGRFSNLARWTVPFAGPFCRAPCGLAKVRQTADGRVGCMGSLRTTAEQLPETPGRQDPTLVERLLLRDPVPCVAHLAQDPGPLIDFVLQDLRRRRTVG